MPLLDPIQPVKKQELIQRCEELISVRFQNPTYVLDALTHSSGADSSTASNERLEFLGDSVLGFTVCEFLFREFPHWNEGELTKIKSAVVSGQSCAQWARKLNLEQVIVVGKGVAQKGELPVSLLADAFEAILAAIFLDQGLAAAQAFLLPLIRDQIDTVLQCSVANNHKSALQQLTQKHYASAPNYALLQEVGPDHDKSFHVAVKIGDRVFPSAWGKSKKEAEQKAAELALSALGVDLSPATSEADEENSEST